MEIGKIKQTLSDAKVYWKRPMPGRYMPFKEIFAYSFGGIGIYFLIYCVQQLTLSTTNVIIGNAIGISPTKVYIIYAISIAISFPATAIRANIIDNARSKQGKYRPYLLSMALPACLLVVGMVMAITAQFFAARAATGFGKELRSSLFGKIQSLSFSELDTLMQ